jgi:hypothetical protein
LIDRPLAWLLFIFLLLHAQEISSLRSKLDSERNKSLSLGSKVAQLGQALSTSQEALQQEKKTVELLSSSANDQVKKLCFFIPRMPKL